jgi:hypothetical protein
VSPVRVLKDQATCRPLVFRWAAKANAGGYELEGESYENVKCFAKEVVSGVLLEPDGV